MAETAYALAHYVRPHLPKVYQDVILDDPSDTGLKVFTHELVGVHKKAKNKSKISNPRVLTIVDDAVKCIQTKQNMVKHPTKALDSSVGFMDRLDGYHDTELLQSFIKPSSSVAKPVAGKKSGTPTKYQKLASIIRRMNAKTIKPVS